MKTEFTKSQTLKNLARAYAGECQAGARYQFIAERAKQSGFNYIGSLMKVVAKNEMAHAKIFYNHIIDYGKCDISNINVDGGYPFKCGNLEDNLLNSAENEAEESERVYPSFAKTAEEEGFLDVAKSFRLIASVENCHKMLDQQLHDKMKSGKLYSSTTETKWKCAKCGLEHTSKEAWDVCPLCKYERGYVMIPITDGSN